MSKGRPRKIIVQKMISDEDIVKRAGTWITEEDIKYPIIESNTDVYWKDSKNELHLLLKFRKNHIHDKLIQIGWDSYKDLAKASRGRGASAGPIDIHSQYWGKRKLVGTKKSGWWGQIYQMKEEMKDGKFDPKNPTVHVEGFGVWELKGLEKSIS